MPASTLITTQQFSRLIGLPNGPAIVDVRIDDDYRADPRLVPASLRRDYQAIASWATDYGGKSVVVHTLAGGRPILALDMYERSYHIDYGAKAATYVDTFMAAIRWSNADRLLASYANSA